MTKIILKKGRDESLKRFHPWVFSGAIQTIEGNPAEGDIVAVYSNKGQFLACGHYQIGTIAVRVLSFESPALLPDFWEQSLRKSLSAREAFGLCNNEQTNCYRLVHGEGDSLPGLIIDYYAGTAVMQAHSAGMFLSRTKITSALQSVYGRDLVAVYDKSSGTAPFKAGLELNDGYLYKAGALSDADSATEYGHSVGRTLDFAGAGRCGENGCGETVVLEHGHKFYVNWVDGQKTGFFLDQRENRSLVEKYAAGRNVLNLFCYTGGFSVYALAGGALHVDSVDSSSKAIETVNRNIELNGFTNHTSYCEDAIEFVKRSESGKYDLMIVDPPAFAKHRGALGNALRGYQRLNAAAIEKIAPGGIIFTFSCSQVVDKNAFALAVFSAAAETGRKVRIIDRFNQPADHPVNIYHPEGEYLKGLVLYVE